LRDAMIENISDNAIFAITTAFLAAIYLIGFYYAIRVYLKLIRKLQNGDE
jgi:hypothetical protein